jgi:hypothetical protein
MSVLLIRLHCGPEMTWATSFEMVYEMATSRPVSI